MIFFFFFQAEDGIRDFHVTGVQTCALPISPLTSRANPRVSSASPWTATISEAKGKVDERVRVCTRRAYPGREGPLRRHHRGHRAGVRLAVSTVRGGYQATMTFVLPRLWRAGRAATRPPPRDTRAST